MKPLLHSVGAKCTAKTVWGVNAYCPLEQLLVVWETVGLSTWVPPSLFVALLVLCVDLFLLEL